jgi:Holliday junction DNA helicase RuvA
MISYIKGVVNFVNSGEGSVSIVTKTDVGYLVFIGCKRSNSISVGNVVSFFIETIVKEDSITLYGFPNFQTQVMFNSLLKVSGVGAKVAMNVLDNLSTEEILQAIISENTKVFQKISGLGEKVSGRIVAELKKEPAKIAKALALCKIGNISSITTQESQSVQVISMEEINDNSPSTQLVNVNDVISALTNLGFDYNRSFTIALSVLKECDNLEEAITKALQVINQ